MVPETPRSAPSGERGLSPSGWPLPSPKRCDYSEHDHQCINVGKFSLVADGGEEQRSSCRTHLANVAEAMCRFYESPVMVDLNGGTT